VVESPKRGDRELGGDLKEKARSHESKAGRAGRGKKRIGKEENQT